MSGRNVGLTGARYVGLILIPAAFPSILAGLKIRLGLGLAALVAAELVFGVSSRSGGIGWYIFEARNDLDTATVFSGLLDRHSDRPVRQIGDLPRHRGAHGQSVGHAAMTEMPRCGSMSGAAPRPGIFKPSPLPRREHQTMLHVVTEIQRDHDATLSYRFACRVGMCGPRMVVYGRPRWTGQPRVNDVIVDGNSSSSSRCAISPWSRISRSKWRSFSTNGKTHRAISSRGRGRALFTPSLSYVSSPRRTTTSRISDTSGSVGFAGSPSLSCPGPVT